MSYFRMSEPNLWNHASGSICVFLFVCFLFCFVLFCFVLFFVCLFCFVFCLFVFFCLFVCYLFVCFKVGRNIEPNPMSRQSKPSLVYSMFPFIAVISRITYLDDGWIKCTIKCAILILYFSFKNQFKACYPMQCPDSIDSPFANKSSLLFNMLSQ